MSHITSSTGNTYYIPVFLTITFFDYKAMIYNYRLTHASKTEPKTKPPPKSRDTYYE